MNENKKSATGFFFERTLVLPFSPSGFTKVDLATEATLACVSFGSSALNIIRHYRAIYGGFAGFASATGFETAGLSTVGTSILTGY